MLGTHDSFTYFKANSWAVNLISKYWRCQEKSITEQYKLGVRFFDVRIKRDTQQGKKVWRCCHGLAEFPKIFMSIDAICNYFTYTLKDCKFRIWLEKGSEKDWDDFITEALDAKDKFEGFVQAVRKSGEVILFQKPTYLPIKYYAAPMEKFGNIVKGIYTNPIKSWAKKHNPVITQEMIDDPDVVYFMDYVGEHE